MCSRIAHISRLMAKTSAHVGENERENWAQVPGERIGLGQDAQRHRSIGARDDVVLPCRPVPKGRLLNKQRNSQTDV